MPTSTWPPPPQAPPSCRLPLALPRFSGARRWSLSCRVPRRHALTGIHLDRRWLLIRPHRQHFLHRSRKSRNRITTTLPLAPGLPHSQRRAACRLLLQVQSRRSRPEAQVLTSRLLALLNSSNVLDRDQLCIQEGQAVWSSTSTSASSALMATPSMPQR